MGLRKVGNVDVFLDAEGLVQSIQLAGRSLYLTSDPGLLRKQFRGENLDPIPSVTELYNHVSTDAIIKANPDCYYYDDRLRSEEHTSELQSRLHLVCRLLLEKKKKDASHST